MDSNIKSLTITGTAAEDATRSRLKGRPSRKLKTVVKDEEDEIAVLVTEDIRPSASTVNPNSLKRTLAPAEAP